MFFFYVCSQTKNIYFVSMMLRESKVILDPTLHIPTPPPPRKEEEEEEEEEEAPCLPPPTLKKKKKKTTTMTTTTTTTTTTTKKKKKKKKKTKKVILINYARLPKRRQESRGPIIVYLEVPPPRLPLTEVRVLNV